MLLKILQGPVDAISLNKRWRSYILPQYHTQHIKYKKSHTFLVFVPVLTQEMIISCQWLTTLQMLVLKKFFRRFFSHCESFSALRIIPTADFDRKIKACYNRGQNLLRQRQIKAALLKLQWFSSL